MDFTLYKYKELLVALKGYGNIILRHDVDLKPENSLKTAEIEAELGYKAVYYFRAVPESWNEEIIIKISRLGHEVGYHYESLTTCNGDIDAAWEDFKNNLKRLRKLVPVNSICMHGSPKSKWDSKDIWEKYDYKTLDITFEPYLDTDWSNTFYLTDTGRRWDGYKVSVRDKISGWQEKWEEQGLVFHSTNEIILAAKRGKLPKKVIITTHPQRWMNFGIGWVKEFALQNTKNMVKRIIIRKLAKY